MTKRIIRLPEVKARTGLSRSSIYAFMSKEDFPKSISLGARAVGWLEGDIEIWLERRIEKAKSSSK